jgi:hypothetical protein
VTRRLGPLVALALATATLLIGQPAEAAGDTYVWVATSPGNFTNPANWERQSDGQPGVPGAGDVALITAPAGKVTVDADVEVGSLVEEGAVRDGTVDLAMPQSSSITADLVSLSGDTDLRGSVITPSLRLSGAVTNTTTDSISLPAVDPDHVGQLFLADASVPGLILLDEPVDIQVEGEGPSRLDVDLADPSSLRLVGVDGGTLDGTAFAAGDVTIVGDIPASAVVYTDIADEPSHVDWSGDGAALAGFLGQFGDGSVQLPDQLDLTGGLEVEGSAVGGTLRASAGSFLYFQHRFEDPTSREPRIALTGTFDALPGAGVATDRDDAAACIGAEEVLVRAAGGVTADRVTVEEPPQIHSDLVALRTSLVSVLRTTTAPSGCDAGSSERLVRSMYRHLLDRLGDARGTTYWASKLDAGTSATSVASSLLVNAEARQNLVRSTYEVWSCDGVPPEDDAVVAGAELVRTGGGLAVLRADVVASTIPADGDPVACLYQAVLGRTPDAGGRAYVEDRLDGGESVQKVARKLMTTSEGRRVQFNRLYERLLGRPATSDEVTAATQHIAAKQTEVMITALIAGSEEYRMRASG